MNILDKVEVTQSNEAPTAETTVSNKQILQGIKVPVELIDDQILVKPLPEIFIEKEFTEYDDKANANKDTSLDGDTAELKKEIRKVPANLRKGVILTMAKDGMNPLPFEPGDTIVYPANAGTDFDLFRDSKLLKRFEVKGKWLNN